MGDVKRLLKCPFCGNKGYYNFFQDTVTCTRCSGQAKMEDWENRLAEGWLDADSTETWCDEGNTYCQVMGFYNVHIKKPMTAVLNEVIDNAKKVDENCISIEQLKLICEEIIKLYGGTL